MIYTFYSFKGGVGRSMALANTAELLCARGLDVLIIDFDLEAPGLERFFEVENAQTKHADILRSRGVVDLILSYKTLRSFGSALDKHVAVEAADGANYVSERAGIDSDSKIAESVAVAPMVAEPLSNFIVPIYDNTQGGQLWLMPAGRRDEDEYARYADRVASLDLADLYTNWGGQEFFDWFVESVNKIAPVVLVDSRTGITEMSGVCTHHLADAVALLVAPNEQNIDGIKRIIRSLERPELVKAARRERPLSLLLIPSRVEPSEGDKLDAFAARFEKELAQHIDARLVFERGAFVDLRIPYVPHYAYVESVAAREAHSPKAADIVAAYNRVTLALVELADQESLVFRTYHANDANSVTQSTGSFPAPPQDFVGREWAFDRIAEWFHRSSSQALVVTGSPGSGKTALIARLVESCRDGRGPASSIPIVFAFTCASAWSDASLFTVELSRALAKAYPVYLQRLIAVAGSEPQLSVRVQQRIGTSYGDVLQPPPALQTIDTGNTGALVSFQMLIVRPLALMSESNSLGDVVIAVDGLDAEQNVDENITSLLSAALSSGRLPSKVRLLVTTRKDARILNAIQGERMDLTEGEGSRPEEDVRRYVSKKLEHLRSVERETITDALAKMANGNFLVTKYALDSLPIDVDTGDELFSKVDHLVENGGLVSKLAAYLAADLNSTLRSNAEKWTSIYRSILSVLAAAHEPLTTSQIAGILRRSKSELADALGSDVAQFLLGELPNGPFRLFHASLGELIAHDVELGVEMGEVHERIADFFITEYQGIWSRAASRYPTRYTVSHLLASMEYSDERRRRKELSEKIVTLMFDYDYLLVRIRSGETGDMMNEIDVTLSRGEVGDAAEDLKMLMAFLSRAATILQSWDESAEPDLLVRLVTESGLTRLQLPPARTSPLTESNETDSGQKKSEFNRDTVSGENFQSFLRKTDTSESEFNVRVVDAPLSLRAAQNAWLEAQRNGRIWLAVAIVLCAAAAFASLGESIFFVPIDAARGLYVLVVAGVGWSAASLIFSHERKKFASASYAGSDRFSSVSSMAAELLEFQTKRTYRLVGSLLIASPYLEATTILYVATLAMVSVSRLNPVHLFAGF